MTRTEALAIVAKEHPCPHESWEGGGTTDWAKCADCGVTFNKATLPKRKAAAEEFQRALAVAPMAGHSGPVRAI